MKYKNKTTINMEKFEVGPTRVILEPVVADNVTASGIILTTKEDSPATGVVVAVYSGERAIKFFGAGDTVLFNQNQVVDITINGSKYLMTNEVHIYGKITK